MNGEKLSPNIRSSTMGRSLFVLALLPIIAVLSAIVISRSDPGSTSSSSGAGVNPNVPASSGLVPTAATIVTVSQASSCPPDWYDSPDDSLRDRCAREKGTVTAKQQESAKQTAVALATAHPSAPAPAPVPSTSAYASAQPRPTIPRPQNSTITRAVDWGTDLGGDHILQCMMRDATDIWLDGFVPNEDYTRWDRIYVVTRPGNGEHVLSCVAGENSETVVQTNPTIQTVVRDTVGSEKKYVHTWVSPKPVKALYITNIVSSGQTGIDFDGSRFEGLNSIVYFKTATGDSGSFDMTTETWHFVP